MSDLSRMYSELGGTVEPGALTPPEELRRGADRRARRRTLVVVAGAVLAIAGTAVVVPNLVDANGPGPIVGTTPTAEPTDVPSSTPPTSTPTPTPPASTTTPGGQATGTTIRPPTSIPDRAFLIQPKDTLAGVSRRSPEWQQMLPKLCGRKFGTDASIVARRSLMYVYGNPPTRPGHVPDAYLVQTITSYEDRAASTFMDQLADAVRDCRQESDGPRVIRYKLLTAPDRGDEALLIQIRSDVLDINTNEATGTADTLVSVVRIGPVVTILHDISWESGVETQPEVMQNFTRLAVDGIDNWLR
ncbi:hypothetical protein [Plantactinospora sp. DSM 117369]